MSNKTANALNDLISIARDGKDFYEEAAQKVDDAELKTLFARIATTKAQIVGDDAIAGGEQFVQAQLQPQFAGLVNDDEQHLVMRGRNRMLGRKDALEIEIGGIGDVAVHACALAQPARGRNYWSIVRVSG